MTRSVLWLPVGTMLALSACSASQQAAVTKAASSPTGQLFCGIQTQGGGAIVVGIIDAAATVALPAAGPVVALATGAAKSAVDATCAAAGGIAVSPPANPAAAPQVAVKLPAGMPTVTVSAS